MYSTCCTVACRRGWEVHSWQCRTVPEKGGVKYVVFIVSEFCQAMAQILIAASALPVYQGLTARQRCILLYAWATLILRFRYMCTRRFYIGTTSPVNPGLKLVANRHILFTAGGDQNQDLAYQASVMPAWPNWWKVCSYKTPATFSSFSSLSKKKSPLVWALWASVLTNQLCAIQLWASRATCHNYTIERPFLVQ